MVVGKLHRASQRQQLNVLELNVARGLVFAFARIELRNNAVSDVPVVVDDEDVLDANVLIFQERLSQSADDGVEILIALQALDAERDAGHDGLFLLDNHTRVGADLAQVEVVLDAESETEHERQQQKKPGAKTLYGGRNVHPEPKRANRHLTLSLMVKKAR